MKPEFIVQRKDDKGNSKDFVLYAGLLDEAHGRGLKDIITTLVQAPSELNNSTAIVHASVTTTQGTFSGLGDANPGNVTRMMVPHIIRMAETRAKARALRDAVNIGVTALEELGEDGPSPSPPSTEGAARRPSVAVRGAQRVDEDAGRTVSTGWPRTGSAQDDGTATPPQRKLLRELGAPRHDDPALMRADASALISDAIAKKGGA